MEKWEVVEDSKASKWLRLANMFIDSIVFIVICFMFGLLLGVLDVLFNLNTVDSLGNMNNLLDRLIGTLFIVAYYFLTERFLQGRSIAKIITGTKVVTENGDKPSTKEYFIRSISRIVPFDALSFLGEDGWHDNWSDTRVVVSKKFDMGILNSDILNNFDSL